MAASSSTDRINKETTRKAVNALLRWKKLQLQSDSPNTHKEDNDDFIYLSITLKKIPPKNLIATPHRIPLRYSLLPRDFYLLNLCLIVDGKKIKSELARQKLKSLDMPIKQVLKLSKLKSDYKSFDAKKKLFDSFDMFFAVKDVVPLLPEVLGKVFYKKKRKIPMPVHLSGDCNWKEEIERACTSSLLCLSGGTCSAVRVGRWGVTESKEIVENLFTAIDGVLEIVPKKWGGIRALHLKFSDSLALPIYEHRTKLEAVGKEN
ncbi:ribosomal L1 domain-containing 1-like [Olea europaea subsp. europaea]|uniref:Ribosomal L1 domain-containing 1-like n=2 Tax=Olea europaea subsp. europaea TaxID=158383 RepID=A0A8S0RXF0_OLEEU|nr:ribosomal L1 domain-containing 1-like [Olea europaea subsp. europaea]